MLALDKVQNVIEASTTRELISRMKALLEEVKNETALFPIYCARMIESVTKFNNHENSTGITRYQRYLDQCDETQQQIQSDGIFRKLPPLNPRGVEGQIRINTGLALDTIRPVLEKLVQQEREKPEARVPSAV